jgi:hypothetical protein
MTKRPALGPETVVRKSRLATKGEAIPALVLERLSPLSSTTDPVAGGPPPESHPAQPPQAAALPPGLVENLMTTLAERDRQLEQTRAEAERAAEHWSRERSEMMGERDRLATELAAADATVDELRNRINDLRTDLERSRKDMALLMQQQTAERQLVLSHHRQEIERLMALVGARATNGSTSTAADPATESGLMPKARRWLFGSDDARINAPAGTRTDLPDETATPRIINRRPVT